jgi:hypothetical protein
MKELKLQWIGDLFLLMLAVQFALYTLDWRFGYSIADVSPEYLGFKTGLYFFNILFFGPVMILTGGTRLVLGIINKQRLWRVLLAIGVMASGFGWLIILSDYV